MKTDDLRKTVKRLLIDLDMDRLGNRTMLAGKISTEDDQVNVNSLAMAMTGYRDGPRYRAILIKLYIILMKEMKH